MRTYKSLAVIALSLICSIGAFVSIKATAEVLAPVETDEITAVRSYDEFDFNHDGSVNLMDVIALRKYLCGQRECLIYSHLDLNHNQIVDDSDVACLLSRVVENTYSGCFIDRPHAAMQPPTGDVEVPFYHAGPHIALLNNDTQNYDAHSYVKRNVNTGSTEGSPYNLQPSITPLFSSKGSNSIASIQDVSDTRYTTTIPENCGIVMIQYYDPIDHGYYTGTGFVVDDHVIATAAHVVLDVYKHLYYPTIKLHNEDGTLSNTTLTPVEVHLPLNYVKHQCQAENDYALLTVTQDLSDLPHFSIGDCYNLFSPHFSTIPLFVTGNPGTLYKDTPYEIDNTTARKLYSESGHACTTNNAAVSVLSCDVVVSDGDSGGPIYTITKNTSGSSLNDPEPNITYTYTALSTLHGEDGNGHNGGVRFTKYHQLFYRGNNNLSYTNPSN